MIDIVTVVFREELPILRLQAESVELYCQNIGLQTIYVVVNDDESVVKEIDPAWWGILSKYVKIIHRDYFNCKFVENGWVSQQVLKILASALSNNQYTMVLDAKTIFVQPVYLNKLFDSTGRITWGYFPIAPIFSRSKEIVSSLFQINQQFVAGPAGVPFLFHNATVQEMISTVTEKTKQNFSIWFQKQGMVTEFILYSGFIQYRDQGLDKIYNCSPAIGYRLCNVCHSEVDIFDLKFLDMQNNNNITVSVHRNAWKKLSNSQQKAYQDFLIFKGITRAKELI